MIRAPYPIRPEFTPTKASGGLGRLSVQHATEGVMVAENPCGATFGPFYTRTTRGIAAAIAGLPSVDVSTPADTTLGGLDALALTITVRLDDNLARCKDDAYELYSGGDLGASLFETVGADQPGDVVRLWIVQVADERFIFTAETPPDATQADADTLTHGRVDHVPRVAFRILLRGPDRQAAGGFGHRAHQAADRHRRMLECLQALQPTWSSSTPLPAPPPGGCSTNWGWMSGYAASSA